MTAMPPKPLFGRPFRVNYKCECGTHIRIRVSGFARIGWNIRSFTCFKCKSIFAIMVSCSVQKLDHGSLPSFDGGDKRQIQFAMKHLLKSFDVVDIAFYNGENFKDHFCDFIVQLNKYIVRMPRQLKGFAKLFPAEYQKLQEIQTNLFELMAMVNDEERRPYIKESMFRTALKI